MLGGIIVTALVILIILVFMFALNAAIHGGVDADIGGYDNTHYRPFSWLYNLTFVLVSWWTGRDYRRCDRARKRRAARNAKGFFHAMGGKIDS